MMPARSRPRQMYACFPLGERARTLFVVAACLVLVLLGLFLYGLMDSQSQARHDLEKRFDERAQVSAAVVQAIFEISGSATFNQAAQSFGDEKVDKKPLEALAKQGRWSYGAVIGDDGEELASTAGMSPGARDKPHVQQALKTGRSVLSDLDPERKVIEWAVTFKAKSGQNRVLLIGLNEKLIADFLNTFLAKIPQTEKGQSFVLDSKSSQLGGPKAGTMLADEDLLSALGDGKTKGKYGDERYFAAAPIEGSTWKVVLTTPTDVLYEPVLGSRRTVPWLIFGGFALTALFGLFMLRRVATAQAEIERRKLNQHHAMEINDNIIQRLVLAKYALDRGSEEMSQEKLAETLEEAQRLVSGLLEEHPTAGSLRRRGPAETGDGAPRPPAS